MRLSPLSGNQNYTRLNEHMYRKAVSKYYALVSDTEPEKGQIKSDAQ